RKFWRHPIVAQRVASTDESEATGESRRVSVCPMIVHEGEEAHPKEEDLKRKGFNTFAVGKEEIGEKLLRNCPKNFHT
ncbi:151_t:CDS:2, partial [Acaulospora colombiana]